MFISYKDVRVKLLRGCNSFVTDFRQCWEAIALTIVINALIFQTIF